MRQNTSEQYTFGCALLSMFGFTVTLGTGLMLLVLLALWVKAQPGIIMPQRSVEPVAISMVATDTPQPAPTVTPTQVVLIAPTSTAPAVPTILPTALPS